MSPRPQKPPKLPARGGLHPVRLGRRINVREARQLQGNLGEWILENIPAINKTQLEKFFNAQAIVDAWGNPVKWEDPANILEKHVYLYRPGADETSTPILLEKIYQGNGWMVIYKPKGLSTMPRGSYVVRSATIALRRQENNPDLSPAHRLDRATSGLLLFTEKPKLRRLYQDLFQNRKVKKTYLATAAELDFNALDLKTLQTNQLIWVTLAPEEKPGWVRIESRIDKVEGIMTAQNVKGAPNAVTYLRPKQERIIKDRKFIDYEVEPHTGKTHQIRLHFAALGIPLVGDPLYGGFNAARYGEETVSPAETALQLEAVALEFTDPQTGKLVKIDLETYRQAGEENES
ncbi:pseudouridine synthase [Gleimia sp. 6138-11-ORH1]|uniref:pseudouridine synthase n=1 Tax=Gleimia sp. 6138-11-ORH1 TaxID=2973937 RepID=UPI002167D9D5|nr:pseudouridine synthase [Gleimia sp. 6138-11-ORH1]MCS4485064.1 pseudouridine synthase [Gleimia sp. 6138-11-ORH1]